jgi:release factor glutamine methyltransferase
MSCDAAAGVHPMARRGMAAGAMRGWLKLRYQILSRRYDRLVVETIDGVPLIVMPQVFNPVLLRSGAIMARVVAALPMDQPTALRVLDLGTGSGVGAVFAARRGATVTAVDINPAAVRCARVNAILNNLEDRIEARLGDLFEPVKGERFDLILFNPPYYRGTPKDHLDRAWRAQDVFERFAGQLDDALAPGGYALVVLSTDGDCAELLAELSSARFHSESVEELDLINEVVTVYAIRRTRGARASEGSRAN